MSGFDKDLVGVCEGFLLISQFCNSDLSHPVESTYTMPIPSLERPIITQCGGSNGIIFAVDLLHDGSRMISCGEDRVIRCWKLTSHLEDTPPALL